MTPEAIEVRDAARALFEDWDQIKKLQRVAADLEPEDQTPALTIMTRRERMSVDGDVGEGQPQFLNELTLVFHLALYGNSQEKAEDRLTSRSQHVVAYLLSRPSFLTLIEGVASVDETHDVIRSGEKFYGRAVIEMAVQFRTTWPPFVSDDYERTTLATKPLGSSEHTPVLRTTIDQVQP